ncbi:ABC-2 family transporter protein [Paraglaciecola sp.]|uniref:ABC-2 family transporter protein n=1 Tax=Paraglaciecola sp. TaxID=1920173 RepID=UPI0030F48BFD
MFREIYKHIKIYCFLIKINAIKQLEYRLNLFLSLLVELGYMAVKLIYAYIVHDTGVHIAGLSPDSIYLFIGTFMLMTVFFVSMLQFNILMFDKLLRNGDFDLLLTKPVSTQFLSTLGQVETWISVPNILAGLSLLIYGWSQSGVDVSIINIGGYIVFFIAGMITMYCLFTLPLMLAFRFKNIEALHSLLWALWDFNNLPHKVFGAKIRLIGVAIIPIFLITNYSPLLILNKLSTSEQIWGLIAPILLLLLTRFCWSRSIRLYESANG